MTAQVYGAPSLPDLNGNHTPCLSSSSIAAGGGARLTVHVDNIGTGASGPFTAGIYLSTDSAIATSDTPLTTVQVSL